jgi:hypothetical protein
MSNGANSRPESPTEQTQTRPRSLSTNPRAPPFPTKAAARNSSVSRRRPPQNEGSPTLPYADDDKLPNDQFSPPDRRSPAEGMMRSTSPVSINSMGTG